MSAGSSLFNPNKQIIIELPYATGRRIGNPDSKLICRYTVQVKTPLSLKYGDSAMISKLIDVNGTQFRLTLTDQIIQQVNNLKNLYNAAYEDPESFEEISAEISGTIKEIATAVQPPASDSDLDGLIQEIIRVVDNKAAEMEKELESKPKKYVKKTKSKK